LKPEPFDQFLARTAAARLEPYREAFLASPAGAALDAAALAAEFQKMKTHIAELYRGVKPVKSFVDAANHVIDCIPFDQQPSVRAARSRGIAVHEHMPPPPQVGGGPAQPRVAAGNPVQSQASSPPAPPCPPGSVLLRRVTLEDLIASGTLENHLRKFPLEARDPAVKDSHSGPAPE
jgi:hypothetical protein